MSEGRKIYDKSIGDIDDLSTVYFADGLYRLQKFSIKIDTVTNKKKRSTSKNYIVEIHDYNGFAFIKYYPRHLKDNPHRYKFRSKDLGFTIDIRQIRRLFHECALRMKEYLDLEPNSIIGYIGQPDPVDDECFRRRAQRLNIYNTYCTSVFSLRKYRFISGEIFGDFNIRLIRKYNRIDENGTLIDGELDDDERLGLNDIQKRNYEKMLNHFTSNLGGVITEFMTEEARSALFKRLEEEITKVVNRINSN